MSLGHENVPERFELILAEIKKEMPTARTERWRGFFDRLVSTPVDQMVLFGAGQFGQLILTRLRQAGVEPLCFADNNQSRWGSLVCGLEVLSPSDAVQRYGRTSLFVVAIFNGSAARKQLREMGCGQVLPATLLYWKYPGEFMPDLGLDVPERLIEQEVQIRQCYSLLSDDESRQEMCDQIQWRYWMKPEYLPLRANPEDIYFPNELSTRIEREVIVDCGAFDGDTFRSFIQGGRGFRHMYALEPDAVNLIGLRASVEALPSGSREKVTVWPYAVGDKDEEVSFVETHDVASKVSSTRQGITVQCRRLDSLPWQFKPTYIKMDIEGAEPAALAGAVELLKNEQPVLAICLYHRMEHLWQIPNLIHSIAPNYSLYLRRYAEDCWKRSVMPCHRTAWSNDSSRLTALYPQLLKSSWLIRRRVWCVQADFCLGHQVVMDRKEYAGAVALGPSPSLCAEGDFFVPDETVESGDSDHNRSGNIACHCFAGGDVMQQTKWPSGEVCSHRVERSMKFAGMMMKNGLQETR